MLRTVCNLSFYAPKDVACSSVVFFCGGRQRDTRTGVSHSISVLPVSIIIPILHTHIPCLYHRCYIISN